MPPELFVDNVTFPPKLAEFDYSFIMDYHCIPIIENAYQDNKLPNRTRNQIKSLAHLTNLQKEIIFNELIKNPK